MFLIHVISATSVINITREGKKKINLNFNVNDVVVLHANLEDQRTSVHFPVSSLAQKPKQSHCLPKFFHSNLTSNYKLANDMVILKGLGNTTPLFSLNGLKILCTKLNWIGHTLRRNFLLHDAIKAKRVGRRRTQLLDYLRNRRYWELNEEAEDRKRYKGQFITNLYFFLIFFIDKLPFPPIFIFSSPLQLPYLIPFLKF